MVITFFFVQEHGGATVVYTFSPCQKSGFYFQVSVIPKPSAQCTRRERCRNTLSSHFAKNSHPSDVFECVQEIFAAQSLILTTDAHRWLDFSEMVTEKLKTFISNESYEQLEGI